MPSAFDTLKLLENPAFKSWFGRSRMVDERGAPSTLYHSTSAPDFDSFRRKLSDVGIHLGTLGQAQDRVDYLSSIKDLERNPRLRGNPRIMPLVMRAESPFRMEDAGSWDYQNLPGALKRAGMNDNKIDRAIEMYQHSPNALVAEMRRLLKGEGHDSIVYRNTGEVEGAHPLQLEQDRTLSTLIASQRARRKSLSVYDPEDMATPEYQEYRKAYDAQHAFRHNNTSDSYIALEPTQLKSIFNRGTFDAQDPRLNYARGGLALARDYGR